MKTITNVTGSMQENIAKAIDDADFLGDDMQAIMRADPIAGLALEPYLLQVRQLSALLCRIQVLKEESK